MKVVVLSLVAGLAFAGGEKLATKYSSERDLKYEVASRMSLSLTAMERNGEPVDVGGHEMKTEMETTEVHTDHVVELADGQPTKVRRAFEKVGGTLGFTMGEDSRDSELHSGFEGVTLEIAKGKDGLQVDVVEGTEPDAENALKGHRLESFLDGLLPSDAVAVDDHWDLESDAITRALRLDVRRALFANPNRGEDSGGEGGGRRRGGGMRGGANGLLDGAEWKGTAKLVSADKEIDGVSCSVVELKLTTSGERELPAMRGPRGGMFGPAAAFANTMSYEATLEGTFAFANKEHRPVKLALEGHVRTVRNTERETEEGTMSTSSTQEGKLEIDVAVSEETPKTAKAEK